MGIEPTWSAWKAEVLPLNYTRKWCREQELNPQPTDYKSVALPIELSRHMDYKVRFTLTREIFTIYYLHPLASGLARYYHNTCR